MTISENTSPCPRLRRAWAFFRAAAWPRRLAAGAALLLAAVSFTGCGRSETSELPLYLQAAEVDAGTRDTILVEKVALGDVDLDSLAYVTGLQNLLCDNPDSQFTAAGLNALTRLKNLRHLRLRGHGIDDAALSEIANISSLRILNIPQAEISDAGLTHLAELPNLEQLRIGGPNVSSAGIEKIAALLALKRLHTIDIPVDDDALRLLGGMKHLESLYIDGGKFSDAAVEELFRARPELHVHFNQEHHDRDPHRHSHQ